MNSILWRPPPALMPDQARPAACLKFQLMLCKPAGVFTLVKMIPPRVGIFLLGPAAPGSIATPDMVDVNPYVRTQSRLHAFRPSGWPATAVSDNRNTRTVSATP